MYEENNRLATSTMVICLIVRADSGPADCDFKSGLSTMQEQFLFENDSCKYLPAILESSL